MAFREVKLSSGAVLKVAPAPFAKANALHKAMLGELKGIQIHSSHEVPLMLKDMLCTALSSQKIEDCLWACFEHCIYNGGSGDLKIDKDTFEPVKAREDYVTVCKEVAEENVRPFMKSLYAEFLRVSAMIDGIQA